MPALHAVSKMTVEEFLALPETTDRMELVNGEILMCPKPISDHQEIQARLTILLGNRVGNAGRLLPEKELIVRMPDGQERVRVPALCYIQEVRRDIVKPEAIYDGPDIVIEILSESTEEVDRFNKKEEYRESGVTEYWIVDIFSRAVRIHHFSQGRQDLHREQDTFESEVLRSLGLQSEFSVREIFEILK